MHPQSSLRYTAIGDSITAGVGGFYIYGYAYQYRSLLQKDFKRRVLLHNLGKSGWTSYQLLQALRKDPAFIKAIQTADIITCSIGGNDLLQAGRVYDKTLMKKGGKIALKDFEQNFLAIDKIIKNIKKSSNTPYSIRYIELYNPLPEFPLARQLVKNLNQILYKAADSHTKIAPVHTAFLHHENKLLFLDGIHPNYHGHRLIAETIRKLD